jgi:CRISPR-associated endonuclease/helicase Cas3
MQTNSYWAHSAPNSQPGLDSRVGWQLLSVHLEAVSQIARELASAARPLDGSFADLAYLAGILHDFGKYSDCFQQMLKTGKGSCQHAIHGAILAYFGAWEGSRRPALQTVAAAIAGHHAGLSDWTPQLQQKLREQKFRSEGSELLTRASSDCGELDRVLLGLADQHDISHFSSKARFDLYVRLLFSCLVDADRLDSGGRRPTQADMQATARLNTLLQHIGTLQGTSQEGSVKQMRAKVLENCLQAASSEARLFSLSVPTGGGKTLAAMAFALRRASLYPDRFRRVIVVIPYLSIIEQSAKVYSDIFGQDALLEHHSGSIVKLFKRDEDHFSPAPERENEEDKRFQETGLRPETENWDSPLVVTTSVRFFESLFSDRPSDLRRVHNIARSIVILDEVQTLPRRLLGPLLEMMKELADDWGTNFVFSTATQPAFERPLNKALHTGDLRWAPGTLTEIVHDPAELHRTLKRVEIHWKIDHAVGWPEIAQRMVAASQCLAIVNVRDHANQLYDEVLHSAKDAGLTLDGVFHLSTRMSGAHRLRVLNGIRRRLEAHESCHVVSTQLIEAGVDVDFPLVLRALAPLDSIVQAAGRADREGKRTMMLGRPGGEVVVFLPEDHKLPPNEYKEAAGITEAIAKDEIESGGSVQVDSVVAIQQYFERYYGESGTDLGQKLVEHRQHERFATLAQEFEMISSRTRDVFVPDDSEARKAIAELRSPTGLTPGLQRTLQRHVVGLSPSEFENAKGVVERIVTVNEDEIWVAVDHAYDERLGLVFDPGPGRLVL